MSLEHKREGYYSKFITLRKKPEGLRRILNLKPMNGFIKRQKFKMEMLRSVKRAVKRGDWLCTVDLKDAYMHIPIRVEHRKSLRFRIALNSYQWKVTPFGMSSAPRMFTKVLVPVIADARKLGVHTFPYLDDVLVQHKDQRN